MSLKNVVALVTGAGSGMGRATSTRLVQQGARVILADLASSKGAEIARELGENARFHPTDVVSEQDVTAALDLAESAFGRSVNVAVNHAGILMEAKTLNTDLAPHPVDVFKRVLEVNAFGTFQVSRLAAERMAKLPPNHDGERGVIINTASLSTFEGMTGQIAYSASKGAVASMTLPMARDLGTNGIRVVSIAPGGFRTGMNTHVTPEVEAYVTQNLIAFPKRMGDPSEIALMVQSIIENPMLNGDTIRVDGGLRLPPGI